MNPKINKVIDEITRAKAKIAELQALLPELERKRVDMENTEIIRLVRSADIAPADFPAFVAALKNPAAVVGAVATPEPEPLAADTPDLSAVDAQADGQVGSIEEEQNAGADIDGENDPADAVHDIGDNYENGNEGDISEESWDGGGDYSEEDDAHV